MVISVLYKLKKMRLKQNLKLTLQVEVSLNQLPALNTIISKLSSGSIYDLWQSIQHLDVFFVDDYSGGGFSAAYDPASKAIDFRDEDQTVVFYVQE